MVTGHKDKKGEFHPHSGSGKAGVSENDMKISVKGNNDVIKVDNKEMTRRENQRRTEIDKTISKAYDKMLDSGKIFNLRQIKANLDAATKEKIDPFDESSGEMKRIYAGSVYALTPSGKYYTAFASGNVSDKEAKKDEKWWEDANKELGKIGASLESGEDSPDELFIVQTL